jgi:PAS domain S-box-containing protein
MGKPARKQPLKSRGQGSLTALRRKAERLVSRQDSPVGELSLEALRRMLHELQVHEIELQMQNEELIRAQLELEESRNRYADLFNFAPVAYLVMEADETVCEANQAAERLFGFELPKLLGRRFWRLVHLDSREELRTHLRQVREKGKRLSCEVDFSNMEGRRFTGHVESEAFRLVTDERSRIRSAIVDVTARKEAERTHRQSERALVAVSEREKQRFGADLHDGLGQWLTATEFLGAALREKLAEQCPDLEPQCAQVCANLREAISQTRAMARGMAPVRLEQAGLMEALKELVHRVDGVAGVRSSFDCPVPVNVAQPVTANHLFRIAQEAVSNAIRHGKPRQVRVALRVCDGTLNLHVKDDGRGFDPSRRARSGLGLELMRHRATVLGGELIITAAPRCGVSVECLGPQVHT